MRLNQGNLSTHVIELTKLNFNLIKEDIVPKSALFYALKNLCATENCLAAIREAEKTLHFEEDLKSFDLLTLPFINPAKTLKSLTLSAGDIFEIQYAMQLTLFKCFCEELLSDAEEDKLWKQETIQVLKRRFDTIKSVDDAKPNYLQGVGLVSAGLVGAVFVAASIVMLAYAIFCLIDFVRKESLEKVLSILIAAISICSQVSGTHYGAFGRLTRGFPLFCDAVKSSFRETRNVRIPLAPPPPEMEEETVPASPQLA